MALELFIVLAIATVVLFFMYTKHKERLEITKNNINSLLELQAEIQSAKDEFLELSQQVEKEKLDLERLLAEKIVKETTLSSLQVEIQSVRNNFFELSRELENEKIVKNTTLSSLEDKIKRATEELNTLDAQIKELQKIQKEADETVALLEKATKDIPTKQLQIEELTGELHELQSKLDLYSRVDEFVEFGHFEMPAYLYETSYRFAEEIKMVRNKQKKMLENKNAFSCTDKNIITTYSNLHNTILQNTTKLMLRVFNIECDFLIEKVTPASYTRTLERIEKLANDIEKLSLTLECGFNIDYIKLKFDECTLQYQYKLKKQEEQEEQIAIKEQMREEQKAIQEYERAIRDAEKEERLYTSLLEKARIELEKASESEKAIMAARVSQLEVDLAEALARGERAKSMAEQTKKGYIYVISNIGSFGEDVYKIGMTRRLDPMERVRELSNASVPFPFDVHAMIYYEDAPKLESQLHKEFNNNRVNAVNLRKEFFNVELEKIRDMVEKITDNEADFKMTVLAEQYNETLRLLR